MTVTGTASITSLGAGFAGCKREVVFSGTPTLVHSANLYLPTLANITVAANDILTFRCTGSGQWALVGASRSNLTFPYTPVNKAGDTGIGSLGISGDITVSGRAVISASGTLGRLNVGLGRSYFGSSNDLFAVGLGYSDALAQLG